MPACAISDAELGLLLHGFQARHPEQVEQFFTAVVPILRRLARRCAKNLPSDIHEEVVQETFARLLRPGLARFDATRGTVQQYLIGFVLNAMNRVQHSYGRRSHVPKKDDTLPASTPQVVPLDEAPQKFQAENPERSLHQRIAARQVFEKAPPILQIFFERVYFADEPQTQVAADLNMDRFALRRHMAAFARHFTAAQLCA